MENKIKDVIYVRIEKEYKQKLDMIALEQDRSLNNLVIRILKEYIEKNINEKNDKTS